MTPPRLRHPTDDIDADPRSIYFKQAGRGVPIRMAILGFLLGRLDLDAPPHTLDVRYRWPIGERSYIEPHVRYYTQTEADFYRLSLDSAQPLPEFASSDYRLGNFDAITAGLKYGWTTRNGNDMSVRVEWYTQSGEVPAGQLIGNQASRDNYPDLNAVIVQFSYRFSR